MGKPLSTASAEDGKISKRRQIRDRRASEDGSTDGHLDENLGRWRAEIFSMWDCSTSH